MGDLETLRAAQAAVALCVLLLLSIGTYRPTGSPFAAWWSGVVAGSGLGTLAYVLGEESESLLAAVLGNGASVAAASLAWAAARYLRGLPVAWWHLVLPGVATAAATWWEQPSGAAWPGGAALLAGMGLTLGASAVELVSEYRNTVRVEHGDPRAEARAAIATLTVASVLATAFYALRLVLFISVGPESMLYDNWVGPRTTTFLVMLMLVVVSYTVTALSHYQTARLWRAKALRDDLTGLLQRQAFLDKAHRAIDANADGVVEGAVIVADIDHFKEVNDLHGHAYGDVVLVGFSRAVRSCLGLTDFAGRFGGEEFVVFLAHADIEAAKAVTREIDTAFTTTADAGRHVPTVSYGVALLADTETLEEAIHAADQALYRAKRAGRARVEAHVPEDS